ncbi:glycosyltransferase family 2 protein [Sphingorhabdus lacus]|uniref:glycosyltransferase family 2 protein n=1 Tax=Sphingorhabdus lacus TaxID=392610 RepID=UPI003593E4A2
MTNSLVILSTWLLITPLSIALAIFTIETLLGLKAPKPFLIAGNVQKTVILMPAHNEALTIGNALAKLQPILSENIGVLVVADNCSDRTSEIVESFGFEVIDRTDPNCRGKGHALAFGRDKLKQNPPDSVIIIDADCITDARSIRDLSRYCINSSRPVQARYILNSSLYSSPMVQISNFAFWVKNVLRQRGSQRLGGAALLTGTGMAFPWQLFEDLPLATSNIVEDLGLAVYLTGSGTAPIYLEQALVTSLPASEGATLDQRTRWEHGFIATAREFGIDSLWKGAASLNWKQFLLGLHLMVPPVALLFGMTLLTLIFVALLAFATGELIPLAVLLFAFCLAVSAIILAWICGGHRWLEVSTLLKLPVYLFWKLPIYLKLVRGKTPGWNRTER